MTVLVGAIAWAVARRGHELRTPTKAELADFTDPLGRIAARHLDVSMFSPDLADATLATAAAVNYVTSAPLTGPPAHAGEFPPYDPESEYS